MQDDITPINGLKNLSINSCIKQFQSPQPTKSDHNQHQWQPWIQNANCSDQRLIFAWYYTVLVTHYSSCPKLEFVSHTVSQEFGPISLNWTLFSLNVFHLGLVSLHLLSRGLNHICSFVLPMLVLKTLNHQSFNFFMVFLKVSSFVHYYSYYSPFLLAVVSNSAADDHLHWRHSLFEIGQDIFNSWTLIPNQFRTVPWNVFNSVPY